MTDKEKITVFMIQNELENLIWTIQNELSGGEPEKNWALDFCIKELKSVRNSYPRVKDLSQ